MQGEEERQMENGHTQKGTLGPCAASDRSLASLVGLMPPYCMRMRCAGIVSVVM